MVAKVTSRVGRQAKKIPMTDLQEYNKWLSIIFVAQTAVLLILSVGRSLPLIVSYLGIDALQTQAQGSPVYASGIQSTYDINLTVLVALFLLMPALVYGLAATKFRKPYEKDLGNRVNRLRWIDFALSGGLMVVSVGLLVGVRDLATLLMLFCLTAFTYVFWLITEQRNDNRRYDWYSFTAGCVAGLVPWIVMAIYLLSDHIYGSAPPMYVFWAYCSTFLLFGCLAANLCLQTRRYKNWVHYLFSERMFMLLGLIVKTALAWQIFAGVLHP